MTKIIFNNGVLKLDPTIEHEKEAAVYLAFNQANEHAKQYIALEKALPRMVGLRRMSHRANYAFDVIQNLNKNGYEIIKKEGK